MPYNNNSNKIKEVVGKNQKSRYLPQFRVKNDDALKKLKPNPIFRKARNIICGTGEKGKRNTLVSVNTMVNSCSGNI